MLSKILGHDARWNAHRAKVALNIQSRRNNRRLNGIEHIEVFGQFAKIMPSSRGFQYPI